MIIDFHTHIFPNAIASATIEALSKNASIPPHSNGMESGLLSQMSEAGVDIAINLPVLTRAKQFDSIQNLALILMQKATLSLVLFPLQECTPILRTMKQGLRK